MATGDCSPSLGRCFPKFSFPSLLSPSAASTFPMASMHVPLSSDLFTLNGQRKMDFDLPTPYVFPEHKPNLLPSVGNVSLANFSSPAKIVRPEPSGFCNNENRDINNSAALRMIPSKEEEKNDAAYPRQLGMVPTDRNFPNESSSSSGRPSPNDFSHGEDKEKCRQMDRFQQVEEARGVKSSAGSHSSRPGSSSKKSRQGKAIRLSINARERRRMHDLNDALDELRSVIPYAHSPSVRKLSKIATLLLAKNYILMQANALEEMQKIITYLQQRGSAMPPPPSALLLDSMLSPTHPHSSDFNFCTGVSSPDKGRQVDT